jgi:cellulose synthase/poly-beta-1,6-N-acetylglucosamine synthase-like glycosyltransferase
VVIIVDADCKMNGRALERLAKECAADHCPVQGHYQMKPPAEGGIKERISWFAFEFKNHVRPLGLRRLGMPSLLFGTGMAFPWSILRHAPVGSRNIVEDMQLAVDLALAGHPPKFVPESQVMSEFPAEKRSALVQRTRWEHGHLRTLLTQVPRLVVLSIRRRRIDLFGLALELSVPPLAVLFMTWACACIAAYAFWYCGAGSVPGILLTCSGIAAMLSILAAWWKFGRNYIPLRYLLAAPLYALWKLPLYARFLYRPQQAWVRTDRHGSCPP